MRVNDGWRFEFRFALHFSWKCLHVELQTKVMTSKRRNNSLCKEILQIQHIKSSVFVTKLILFLLYCVIFTSRYHIAIVVCNLTWHQLSLPLWLPAVSSSSGDIFVIEPLDYEISHEYYITIEATDGGSPPLSDMATVNINLTDVNDNRPVFSQDVYTAVVSEDTELGKAVLAVRNTNYL